MKWIIVTGVSGDLGEGIAQACLGNTEFGVIAINRNNNRKIKSLKKNYGERFHFIQFDLSNIDDIKKLFLHDIKKIGPIYGLVNNAAIAYSDIVTNANIENISSIFKVNVFAPIILTKYAIRNMLLNKTKGVLVYISSISATTGYKGLSIYAATKGSLESFSKGISREWGPRGIRSVCVAPGFMETEMSKELSLEDRKKIYRRSSLGKETEINSVSKIITHLLTDDASSLTGEVIHIDCGSL